MSLNLPFISQRRDRAGCRDRPARRLRDIVGVAVRYGLADQLRKLPGKRMQQWLSGAAGQDIADLATPVRIRMALTDLGTTFIKFGQMLSTRADLVGEDVAQELTRLQNDTRPDPPGVAEATIRKELGAAATAVFASFDPTPFASASIAQVHYARLHSGENVVVKIQKDGIERDVKADLGALANLALLAQRIPELKPYHPVAVVRQFAKMMTDELDFLRELRNLQQFQRHFAADQTVHFPVPYPDLCSRRVLTMERLEGVLVSQIRLLPEQNPDLEEFALRGANMYLEMIFRDSFYHADPHPGNMMYLPGGVVGVLDCGMVQRLEDDPREAIEDLLLAFVHGDSRSVTDAIYDLCTSPPPFGRQRLHADVAEVVADFAGQAIGDVDIARLSNRLTGVIHRNQLFLPPGVSLLLRMLAQLEGTAKLLNPSFSLSELVEPYAEKAARRRLAPARIWLEVQRSARQWERLARSLPADLNDMLLRLRTGRFRVNLDHRHLDPVVNRLVIGLLTSSLLLGSSLLWSMHAEPLVRGVSLFGAIGYGLALATAVRLLRAIRRSERPPEDF